jgi:CHAD domain-containing protein
MAYRLKAGESVAEAIKRIASEEIGSAISQLGTKNGHRRDEAIHEARKSLKKVRGALRLVQPELGRVYSTENTRLRELAHKLSDIRDATAIIEVFDDLIEAHKDNLQKDAFVSIRRGLEKSKRETEQALRLDQLVRNALSTLRAAEKRIGKWPLKNDGFTAVSAGIEKRYRRGRKAMAVAQKDPTPENYHEWRKRVKDHWYQMRLLESLWTGVMQAREASLKNLETWLGDDHNLIVLRGKLEDDPRRYGEDKDIQLFLTLLDRRQNELRENAKSLGQRIYEEKPAQFTRDLAKLWDAWQKQPDSMKEIQKQERDAARKQPGRTGSARSAKKTAVA